MRFVMKTGKVKDNLYALGTSEFPVYLVDTPHFPIIFDSGITCLGKIYVDAIRSVLGNRAPSILFLSHVHWDHCGTASYLKRAFPSMQIAASPLANSILKRPNAVELITRLNEGGSIYLNPDSGLDYSQLIDEQFEPFKVDMELKDEQAIVLNGGITVKVLETPGHTRDHLSFYLPEEKILIAPESGGYMNSAGIIETEFVADYEMYLESMRRLAELPAEILCQGHNIIFVGREEVSGFFNQSMTEAVLFKDRIYQLLEIEHANIERVVQQVKAERYDNVSGFKQDEITYILNLTAQVRHLAGKWSSV